MSIIKNLIAGSWEESAETFITPLGTFSSATKVAVDRALIAAKESFQAFAETTTQERANFLKDLIHCLAANKVEIIAAYTAESQLPAARADGEFGRTIGQILRFVELLEEGNYLQPIIESKEGTADLRKMNHPIGPIAVFGASNFPLAFSTAGGDSISAFAAGCPVIVKSHPYHPYTSFKVASAIHQAVMNSGLPAGIFSHLQAEGHELGQDLVLHPLLKGVGFTGSFKGGKALYDMAQQRSEPIPVFAEMGSVNPMVILPHALANKEDLAKQLVDSITLGSGQFCTNPGLIIALGSAQERAVFEEALIRCIQTKEKQPMVHQSILTQFESKLNQHQKELKVVGGVPAAMGFTIATAFLKNLHWAEEVFGPYSLFIGCEQLTEVEAILNSLDGQLTLSLIGDDKDHKDVARLLPLAQEKAGRILFEGVPTGVAVTQAMMHGGPFPASTDSRFSAVGTDAIFRWLRPIAYQDCPDTLLPPALQKKNPLHLNRVVNGVLTKESQ